MAKTFHIALAGLPSSGKSTIINSLVSKRLLQSGLARTTTQPTYIGTNNVFSLDEDN